MGALGAGGAADEPTKSDRTRMRVVDAFDQMLKEAPAGGISVTGLCARAGVSRTTFYEHFDNLTDVGVWMWDHVMEEALYQIGIRYGCYEGHLAKFRALERRREFFELALRATDYSSVMQHAGRIMLTHYCDLLESRRGAPLDEYERTRLRLFVVGAKHMTRDWAREGMRQAPGLMARVFTDAMPDFVLPYLEPLRDAGDEGPSSSPCAPATSLTSSSLLRTLHLR